MANRTYICLVSRNFLFHCIQLKVFFPENLFFRGITFFFFPGGREGSAKGKSSNDGNYLRARSSEDPQLYVERKKSSYAQNEAPET